MAVTIDPEASVRRAVAIRLTVLARLLRSDFDRHASDFGITRSQWSLIAVVTRYPGETQRRIAEMLEMSEVSAGRAIDRLVGDGMLERRARNDDRRARAIYVTAKADPLLADMSAMAQRCEDQLFRGLSEAQLADLRDMLDTVYANVALSQADPPPRGED